MSRLRQSLQIQARDHMVSATGSCNDWPDPAPLGDELPPVQSFDLDLLPVSFRPLVEDVSERMQMPADFPAAGQYSPSRDVPTVVRGCDPRPRTDPGQSY